MSNSDLVRGLYNAFASGDVPTVLGSFDPEISWTEAAGFPYAGTYIGANAVLENVFMKLATEWDGFAAIPDEIVDGGETVVALGNYSGTFKTSGKSMNVPFAHVYKFKDGKISSFVQHTDTLKVSEVL
jgi:uncharacterized protein